VTAIFNDTKHRAATLRRLAFLLYWVYPIPTYVV